MIYKEPTKGFKGRKRIKKGIDKASQAVKPTLGAIGMSAIIDMGGDYSRGPIVSSIIEDKYPQQDMDAIRLNYDLAKDEASGITDEKRAEYLNDYKDMQSWRTHAKEIATKVIEIKQ